MANKTVYRVYDLVVYGNIIAGGTIDEPIKRHPVDRVKMAILPGGRDAVTHYNVKNALKILLVYKLVLKQDEHIRSVCILVTLVMA